MPACLADAMGRRERTFAGTLPGTGRSLLQLPSTYVVVDLETTGLDPVRDQIIEIGALEVIDGKPGADFTTLVQPVTVQPGQFVSPFITRLTGIGNDQLLKAPQAAEALAALGRFLGDRIVLGYNVGFDMGFLQQGFRKELHRALPNDWVDVLPMAQTLFPLWEHHRLNNLAAWYRVENPRAHRALSDVLTTDACYRKVARDGVKQFGSRQAFLEAIRKKLNPEEGEQLSLW